MIDKTKVSDSSRNIEQINNGSNKITVGEI